jgi:hypothetical protein
MTAKQNTVGHKQKVSNETTNLHLKGWKELNNQPTKSRLIVTELGPKIKSTHQGLKRTAQPKQLGWPYLRIRCWVTSVTPLMQGNANVNSVEPPLAPQKQRIKTTSQTGLMITTEKQYFMKAEKNSQLSLIHWPTCMSNAKCHKYKHKHTQINEDFLKSKGRYYNLP